MKSRAGYAIVQLLEKQKAAEWTMPQYLLPAL
jgi:hypothetical protein